MKRIADETVSLLIEYEWRGNVRELENTIERAVLLGKGETLMPNHLIIDQAETEDPQTAVSVRVGVSVREMEKELIFQTLKEVNENRTRAAELLGISIRTLRNKLREYKMNN
jgi:DNA-binding NtrC family response regulator